MYDMHKQQQMQSPHDRLLTTRDVQDMINVDRSTIYRMAEDGRLPAVKVGRQWRFPESRIREWLGEAGHTAPDDRGPGARMMMPPEGILQALADVVGTSTGAMVIVADMAGNPLTDVANPCGFFQAVAGEPSTLQRCIEGWREYGDDPDLQPRFTPSHLGFLCARGFARIGSELAAMVIVGGIAPQTWPPPTEEVERMAAELGLPPATLTTHIDEVYRLDAEARRRILEMLPRIGVLVSQIASDRARLMDRLDSIASLARTPSRRSTS
jgi:excisionase family DNA binding protein